LTSLKRLCLPEGGLSSWWYLALDRIYQVEPCLQDSGRPRSDPFAEGTLRMPTIDVGVDASKGYADFCFRNEAGSILWPSQRYDDTPADHEVLRQAFARLRAQHPGVAFRIGVECTGGLERNWLRLFRSLGEDCRVYRLNPLAVKKFLETDLHGNVNDALSARGIAEYLRRGLRRGDVPYEPELEGPRNLMRHVLNIIDRSTQVCNELQSLLPSVHPDLVAYCRQGFPQWILHLLVKYPTAAVLAEASPREVAEIAYLRGGLAAKLVAAAGKSVASLGDEATALVVRELASEELAASSKVAAQKRQLWELLKDEAQTKLLKSIPGIGRWTAVMLRLEFGSFERFHSDRAVVAFAGLNPRVKKSGDGEEHKGISRRGKSQIRACLYMPMLAAVRSNPVIGAFYRRLREAGKEHLVAITACMAKVLRIAYACVMSGRPFDPEYHKQVQQRREAARQEEADGAVPDSTREGKVGSLDAPISRREAKRRREAAAATPGSGRGRARALVCG